MWQPCAAIQTSYQHIDPELVGNQMKVVISELSGKGQSVKQSGRVWIGC